MDPVSVIKIAGMVKDVSEGINFVSKKIGINQNSVFAKKDQAGKGGVLNNVMQAVDTTSGGLFGTVYKVANFTSGGSLDLVTRVSDKVLTPVMDVVDMIDGPDLGDIPKLGNTLSKLKDFKG